MIPEKPKRQPISDDAQVMREFYWRLFVSLMIPACILSVLLYLPTLVLGNLPNRLQAECIARDESGRLIRIESETQRHNTTTISWKAQRGEPWQTLLSLDDAYQNAEVNCESIQSTDGYTMIHHQQHVIVITPDNAVEFGTLDEGCEGPPSELRFEVLPYGTWSVREQCGGAS